MFEIGGKAKGFEHKYNMNLHVFKRRRRRSTGASAASWMAPWRLADDYHVYGLDWGKDEIRFYVDGVLVRTVENTHWHQPLFLIFDSETMPEWFGMPDDKICPRRSASSTCGRGNRSSELDSNAGGRRIMKRAIVLSVTLTLTIGSTVLSQEPKKQDGERATAGGVRSGLHAAGD